MISELQNIPGPGYVGLTTDCWTSTTTKGYITVTAHYIDESWKMKNKILATRELDNNSGEVFRHTGENLARVLCDIVSEFEVKSVSGITTDNASNMLSAASEAKYTHINCFAHTLQLAVKDALSLNSVDKLIVIARKIGAFFHRSTLASQALELYQKSNEKPVLKPIRDVQTRWNSAYFMIKRLIEIRNDIKAVLHDPNSSTAIGRKCLVEFKNEQWTLLEQLKSTLEPLVSATEVLCSESFATCSAVYPLTFGLLRQHLVVKEIDSTFVQTIKGTLYLRA